MLTFDIYYTPSIYPPPAPNAPQVRKTGASGQQLQEAKMINSSLSALGKVRNPSANCFSYFFFWGGG